MTPEQMRELTELRQYQRDTDIYVQKMEDNQDYHLRVIRNLNSELAAAQARVKELEAHNAERNERTFERNAQAHRD